MKIDILTLFPEFFSNLSNWSIIGRAIDKNILNLELINIRDFSTNKHRKVDDYPFGGGPGMVMSPQPIYNAINSIKTKKSRVIYLSPQGRKLNQEVINNLSKEEHLILLCGHYEGIDNRIIENYIDEEISIGDYVLTGGEIPAMVIIDSVVRLLPNVLKGEESYMDESHYGGLLEHPQYTRPRVFNEVRVPDILISGNHSKIEKWKRYESLKATFIKRPDLLKNVNLTKEDKDSLLLIQQEQDNNS
ncbi:tRNA (guanosine(37)-N1)-methyltransferase TrmD [Tissierella creatinophila]|uniref:tRNA (guanine-N(1)-)-methyltransferase n=1 Tax=Tissierella creatinophila DSM 6911 TaxID=1123403 RepID=A0A1U7M366_TISCR|nr:tRNA (guanosine(37)-N1)-methyltransferase TrmD [Tissierella creatinophila]OLS01741.1 tRNA (guanine-N(1)-)-methyltransferase [Tissierella creatinophila DSM 6911]